MVALLGLDMLPEPIIAVISPWATRTSPTMAGSQTSLARKGNGSPTSASQPTATTVMAAPMTR
jgi:hypothetical protein